MTSHSKKNAAIVIVAAALIAAAACNSSNSPSAPVNPGGGTSNLVVSNATPSDGNSTLTATATIAVNSGGSGFDELDLSETVSGIGHEVFVTWDTNTHAINAVQHAWGNGTTNSGFTQCDPSGTACDPAKIVLDFSGHTLTLTSLAVNDAFGGTSSSTLTGTVAW